MSDKEVEYLFKTYCIIAGIVLVVYYFINKSIDDINKFMIAAEIASSFFEIIAFIKIADKKKAVYEKGYIIIIPVIIVSKLIVAYFILYPFNIIIVTATLIIFGVIKYIISRKEKACITDKNKELEKIDIENSIGIGVLGALILNIIYFMPLVVSVFIYMVVITLLFG